MCWCCEERGGGGGGGVGGGVRGARGGCHSWQVAGPVRLPVEEEGCAAEEEETPEIERRNVHQVYDAIAAHFSATRYKPWPRVKSFLDGLARGSVVADIGCGNGKYMTDARHFILGADRSRPLALIAAERAAWGGSVCVADATYLPLRSGSFDAAICIAVMHHISTRARRVKLLRELARIVRRGGRMLVYAWSIEQGHDSRFTFTAPDELVPWTSNLHSPPAPPPQERDTSPASTPPSPALHAPSPPPSAEGDGQGALLRYCHLYQRGELTELCLDVDGVEVEEEFWDCSNCCVAFRRL